MTEKLPYKSANHLSGSRTRIVRRRKGRGELLPLASRWTASPCVRQADEPLEDHLLTLLDARGWHPQRELPVDDPRWREPVADVAPNADGERMGPPPGASPPMRMTASWLGSKRTCRIQVWWREAAPQWRAPLGLIPKDKRCPTPQLKKPVSGHHPSACSGVKALRKHKRR